MTLRRKTLYTVIGTFLGLVVVLYFVSDFVLLDLSGPLVREAYEERQISLAYLVLSIVGVGLVFSLIVILLLERGVLSRLSRLIRGVERIAESGDVSARVEVSGSDELATLGATINGMLAALVASGDEVRQQYEQERRLREQLEAEIEKRIEFTRALVHELKTPITPVMAASELLLEELSGGPLQALAESIERGASHLNVRIDEFLDMARGEIGALKVELIEMDPLPVLREVGRGAMPAAVRNKQTVTVELPASLPAVIADEERLRQVVLNLMNNATKFTPAGGEITLAARPEDDNLVVEVVDTGRGISPGEQERLFEPYARSTSDVGRLSGLGLGLSLAKTLVELQGGRIWLKKRKGKGSTFVFTVPLASGAGNRTGKTPEVTA